MNGLTPLLYKIHLEPDLRDFRFSGKTEIVLEAARPVKEITLNAKELEFSNCAVEKGLQFVSCPFSVDTGKEEIRIALPETISGMIRVKMDYQGHINDKMAGFYRSR
jgi:hypothetical protein